jgi:hypothetical protein
LRIRLLAIPLVAFAVLGLSGCFVFFGLHWGTVRLAAGDTTRAFVAVTPFSKEASTDIPFTLVGISSDDLFLRGKNKFDTKGNFGGPKALVRDQDLADFLISDNQCEGTGVEPSGFIVPTAAWTAVRTRNPVNDQAKVRKTALEKLNFKAQNQADLESDNPTVQVGFITGAWNDRDGDRVPDPEGSDPGEDGYTCTGGTQTWMHIKGNSPAKNKAQSPPEGVNPSEEAHPGLSPSD